MPLYIVRNDITKIKADAIVTAANPHALVGGGVDRAIHAAAGPGLLRAREEIGDIATGDAAVTSAFFLPARYVIHTVGPVWHDGKHAEEKFLARCYEKSLRLAVERRCASVAFPLISAGRFRCPTAIALAAATKAIGQFLQTRDLDVYLVVSGKDALQASDDRFNDVRKYLDERYRAVSPKSEAASVPADRFCGMAAQAAETPSRSAKKTEKTAAKKSKPLPDSFQTTDATFSETLLQLIEAKGKTDPEIYKRANVNRKHFSKIRSNPGYRPSKTTVIAFAVALELNVNETKDLIGRAGYTLSHSIQADVIVEYFIERREYDVFALNEALFAFDQPLLGM